MSSSNTKDNWQIDLREVIHDKSPRLSSLIPDFMLRPLERFLRVEGINAFSREHGDKKGYDFIDAALAYFPIHVESAGLEHVPATGGVIIASNHPLGGPDAMALMQQVARVRKDQQFLVNDILMSLKPLEDLFVPVNKHGRNSREIIKMIDETFASSKATLIFPAGLVSRKQAHGIEDLEWHKSFIRQAVKHKRDIVPVFIEARNTSRFYNIANWRKRLGIKGNLEMLLLPDEMFRQANKTITIHFGKPLSYSTFTKEKTHEEWATLVKKHVYALPHGETVIPVS